MDQCIALTKKRERCRNSGLEECAGLCRRHFELLSRANKKWAKRRASARKVGRQAITMAEWIVLANEVWKIVGPVIGATAARRPLPQLTSNSPEVAMRQATLYLERRAPTVRRRALPPQGFKDRAGR
jgi:hypothetical protein